MTFLKDETYPDKQANHYDRKRYTDAYTYFAARSQTLIRSRIRRSRRNSDCFSLLSD